MRKITSMLEPGDVIRTPEGDFEVLSTPIEGQLGRYEFQAREIANDDVTTHSAQATFHWKIAPKGQA